MNLIVGLLFVSRKLIVASLALGYPANGTFAGWFVGEGSVPVLSVPSSCTVELSSTVTHGSLVIGS